ncbi:MAG TPA: hypothetical protein VMY39_04300, partial [Planctomycetota bacterium]|nr:hypothetical protein [Planctomycetota bacterium]
IDRLKYDITELQRYGKLYTTVEPFTDRVFLYAITTATKCYTGGYATRNKYCRTHAVSWEGLGTDYAALVLIARPDRFKALVYNFAEGEVTGHVRFWTLDHGRYRVTAGVDDDHDDRMDAATRDEEIEVGRGTPVHITLPAKKLTVIELVQTAKLDDLRERADLALSPLDTVVKPGAVEGVAHNIGSKDVDAVVVALVDADGTVRARKDLGRLDAPIDLVPRRIPFRFDGLDADLAGWTLVIDPEDAVREIYEGNNRVTLGARP